MTKQDSNPSPKLPDQEPARRKGKSGEPTPSGPSPVNLIVILIPILLLAVLMRNYLVGPSYNEVSYSYFRMQLDGLDYSGDPIVDDAGNRVGNLVRRDAVAEDARIAKSSSATSADNDSEAPQSDDQESDKSVVAELNSGSDSADSVPESSFWSRFLQFKALANRRASVVLPVPFEPQKR